MAVSLVMTAQKAKYIMSNGQSKAVSAKAQVSAKLNNTAKENQVPVNQSQETEVKTVEVENKETEVKETESSTLVMPETKLSPESQKLLEVLSTPVRELQKELDGVLILETPETFFSVHQALVTAIKADYTGEMGLVESLVKRFNKSYEVFTVESVNIKNSEVDLKEMSEKVNKINLKINEINLQIDDEIIKAKENAKAENKKLDQSEVVIIRTKYDSQLNELKDEREKIISGLDKENGKSKNYLELIIKSAKDLIIKQELELKAILDSSNEYMEKVNNWKIKTARNEMKLKMKQDKLNQLQLIESFKDNLNTQELSFIESLINFSDSPSDQVGILGSRIQSHLARLLAIYSMVVPSSRKIQIDIVSVLGESLKLLDISEDSKDMQDSTKKAGKDFIPDPAKNYVGVKITNYRFHPEIGTARVSVKKGLFDMAQKAMKFEQQGFKEIGNGQAEKSSSRKNTK